MWGKVAYLEDFAWLWMWGGGGTPTTMSAHIDTCAYLSRVAIFICAEYHPTCILCLRTTATSTHQRAHLKSHHTTPLPQGQPVVSNQILAQQQAAVNQLAYTGQQQLAASRPVQQALSSVNWQSLETDPSAPVAGGELAASETPFNYLPTAMPAGGPCVDISCTTVAHVVPSVQDEIDRLENELEETQVCMYAVRCRVRARNLHLYVYTHSSFAPAC